MTKEELKEQNDLREKALIAYFERIKDEYKVGDVLYLSDEYNRFECGILLKEIYTQKEYGELYIKIPISVVGQHICDTEHPGRSHRTYEIYNLDDWNLRLATEEEIEQSVRKFIKEEIDDKRYEIKEAKEEIKKLNKIKLSLNDRLEELKDDILEMKKTSG